MVNIDVLLTLSFIFLFVFNLVHRLELCVMFSEIVQGEISMTFDSVPTSQTPSDELVSLPALLFKAKTMYVGLKFLHTPLGELLVTVEKSILESLPLKVCGHATKTVGLLNNDI